MSEDDYLPGLEGVPATQSNISDIDGEKGILAYRGYPIEQLAEYSTFEETVLLLLKGELPSAAELDNFKERLGRYRRVKFNVREMMKHFPPTGHPMEMLQTAVSSLGLFYPDKSCLTGSDRCTDIDYVRNMTVRIISRIPVIVAMWYHIRRGYDPIEPRNDLTVAENFLYMLHGKDPDPEMARLFDMCLVLHAEHTINASTFSVLVSGSTLASPYGVIAAAIGTLSGPLHGGANERVVEMLEEIGSPENVKPWLDKQLAKKAKIWGFGHREYSVKDPRATILQAHMEKLARGRGGKHSHLFDTALALEEAVNERLGGKGIYANVDYYSGILYSEMGIPTDQFTPVFAISRAAGWLAHWREQLKDNRIFRPTQLYSGHPPRDYVPMSRRG
jgi:citrate synthase